MKKRIISLFIIICMMLSMLTPIGTFVSSVQAADKEVRVELDGKEASEVIVAEDEKKVVNAAVEGIEDVTYQWQIKMVSSEVVWVNILDKTEQDCEISYPLVKDMLDEASGAYIRCKVTADDEEIYSEPICVTIADYEEDVEVVDSVVAQAYTVQPVMDSSTEYVTITIQYLDESSLREGNEEMAIYSPYIATIVKGTAFKPDPIVSPTYLGFAPYYAKDDDGVIDDNANQIELEFDEVTENIVIKVYYKAIEVNYAIRYFFQNINDDLYTEDVTRYYQGQALTGTIITDEELKSHVGDTTGFEKLYHFPESVAADGSTVFECYYDRNYYLLQFDLDGGYGVDPIYGRYDAPFIVNDPVRTGYNFVGWDLLTTDSDGDGVLDTGDGVKETDFPTKVPAQNCSFKALWEAQGNTSATVVYWLQNADPKVDADGNYVVDDNGNYVYEYSYWHAEEATGFDAGENFVYTNKNDKDYSVITSYDWYKKEPLEYQFYEYNTDKTEAQDPVKIEGDGSSIINIYYDRKEYTLKFVFARKVNGTLQGASSTGDDDYTQEGWGQTITNEDNWNKIIASTEPKCKTMTGSDNNIYYYFEIKDKYEARIDEEWAEINNLLANNPIINRVFVSWRMHEESGYGYKETNNNLKGAYPYMDKQVIKCMDTTKKTLKVVDDTEHIMPAYYGETGSIRYYRYELYFGDALTPAVSFIVNPTSQFKDQSAFLYTGYGEPQIKYFDSEGNEASGDAYGSDNKDYPAVVKFYYIPNEYTLSFLNYNNESNITESASAISHSVTYGSPISSYEIAASAVAYPTGLEPNAYTFAGWYTSPECVAGTEVDWDNFTMPARDVILYAKWVPVEHKVNFFKTYDDMIAYETTPSDDKLYKSFNDITHGNVLGKDVANPTYTDATSQLELVFAGWFYMEAGEKKAYTLLNMRINKDMNIFADWSSSQPQPYRISYVLKTDNSVKVADDSTGFAYGGSTRTFIAKAGDPYNQLYSTYNSGYFPTVGSHSITMQYEDDKSNPQDNTYTFEYVKATDIVYKVEYRNKETNELITSATTTNGLGYKEEKTDKAVVTERFVAIENMVPDAFYKRLVLSVEEDENGNWVGTSDNVITFYYTPNTTAAYYAVHYMVEKLGATEEELKQYIIDGSGGYEETTAHLEGTGTIGEDVSVTPTTIPGFELIESGATQMYYGEESQTAPTLTDGTYKMQIVKEGSELYLFYARKSYKYVTYYYKYNSTENVAEPTEGTAKYGATVTESAKDIENYTCVSSQEQTITIRAENGDTVQYNVIIFYYTPLQYVVEYEVVTENANGVNEVGGYLTPTREVKSGSETFSGSTPSAYQYYEFVGWYKDEACTIAVGDSDGTVNSDTNQFIPNNAKLSSSKTNVFYAKFRLKKCDLTISTDNVSDPDQIFVYDVYNQRTKETITVTIKGEGSVTINDVDQGLYTITQKEAWSWRYDGIYTDSNGQTYTNIIEDLSVEDSSKGEVLVLFEENLTETRWISDNSEKLYNRYGQGAN